MKRLALLFVILALLTGVINAQGPLELDAMAEIIGSDGYGPGRIVFQYPSAWEFTVDGDGYLATRAGLTEDLDFGDEDLVLVFPDFTYQASDYDYSEDTDPVAYLHRLIDDNIDDGLDALSSEALTVGPFNAIYEVYEQEEFQANVFGLYQEGSQPLIAITVGLVGAYTLHEETILAILETVAFDPDYDPFVETLKSFLATANMSETQPLPAESEVEIITLTADDVFVVYTYEAEADTMAYFRVNETTALDDQRGPMMITVDPDGNFLGSAGSISSSSSTAEGDPVFLSYSHIAIYFAKEGTYTLVIGMSDFFKSDQEPIAADLQIFHLPVMEVSAAEPIELAHISGQQHLLVTEEIFAQEAKITAFTADNTGLNLQIRAEYLNGATVVPSSSSFVAQDPDSTLPVTMETYFDPEYSDSPQPGRLVIMVGEEMLPHEGELIPGVETILTVTIEPLD